MTDQELLQAIGQVVESKIEPMRQDIHGLKEDVQELKDNFVRLEMKVDKLDKRVSSLEMKVDKLDKRVSSLETKVDSLDKRVSSLETKVDGLEKQVGSLDKRVGTLEEQMTGVRVYMDVDLKRTLNLLLEGQQALWDRFVPREEYEPLKDRTEVLELTVKRHSQEIRELQLA